jgi:hypothetical protein
VLRIFTAPKIHHPRPGLNPLTICPMASTLIVTPPRTTMEQAGVCSLPCSSSSVDRRLRQFSQVHNLTRYNSKTHFILFSQLCRGFKRCHFLIRCTYNYVRFQVLSAASMKSRVIWYLAPSSHVEVNRRFRIA